MSAEKFIFSIISASDAVAGGMEFLASAVELNGSVVVCD